MAAALGKGKPVYTTRQVGAVLVDASSLLACDGNRPLHVAQHPMTSKFRMNEGPGATSGCADC